jgi:hypothetical protein
MGLSPPDKLSTLLPNQRGSVSGRDRAVRLILR